MAEHAPQSCADGPRLTVVLGRCHMNRDEVPRLSSGQLVPLDEPADWPVEVYCDGKLVGCGQLLTLDGAFCVRVTELAADWSLSRAA
jgi:flagellar motor switch protein FliN